MKRDNFDGFLKEGIREDVKDIKLSFDAKESIKNNTIRKKFTIFESIIKLMNTTIEIPFSCAVVVCIAILLVCGSPFIVTDAAKHNKDIFGCTNVKTVKIQGSDIIFPNNEVGGFVNEKDKD